VISVVTITITIAPVTGTEVIVVVNQEICTSSLTATRKKVVSVLIQRSPQKPPPPPRRKSAPASPASVVLPVGLAMDAVMIITTIVPAIGTMAIAVASRETSISIHTVTKKTVANAWIQASPRRPPPQRPPLRPTRIAWANAELLHMWAMAIAMITITTADASGTEVTAVEATATSGNIHIAMNASARTQKFLRKRPKTQQQQRPRSVPRSAHSPSTKRMAVVMMTTTTAAAAGMVGIAVAHPATTCNGRTVRIVNVVTQILMTAVAKVRAVRLHGKVTAIVTTVTTTVVANSMEAIAVA